MINKKQTMDIAEKYPAEVLKDFADTAYDKKDYSVAETHYRKAAEAFSRIGNAQQASFCYEAAGASAYLANNSELSIQNFEAALQENDRNTYALKQLGFILQEKDKPWFDITRSIACYRTALELFVEAKNPEQIFECAKKLSSMFYEERQWMEALKYSQIALQNDSIAAERQLEWIFTLVVAAYSSKNMEVPDYELSLRYFRQLVSFIQDEIKNDSPEVHELYELTSIARCHAAEIEITRGNPDDAAQWYIQTYAQEPSSRFAEKINMLGYVLKGNGDWVKEWNPAVEFRKLQDSLQNIQDKTDSAENVFEPLLQSTGLLSTGNEADGSTGPKDPLEEFRRIFNKISNKEPI